MGYLKKLIAPFGLFFKVKRLWPRQSVEQHLVGSWRAVGGDFYKVLKTMKEKKYGE